jgi:thiol-disulfide isomerase/thioredoxin
MKEKLFLFALISVYATHGFAQTVTAATIFRSSSSHTSFPDTGRVNGHNYNNVLYTAAEHYSDSSVLIVVPPAFKSSGKVDLIFWFHGWGNNIDSVSPRYDLIKQFIDSKRNAVLVLAETAKDAPDSYGGKLEQKNLFKSLVADVLNKLRSEKIIAKKSDAGNITLAGHSGAYRVMAYIIQNGGMEINQAILFDALYSEVDKYSNWIQADPSHQFINIYTDNGGTYKLSVSMAEELRNKNIPLISTEEKEISPSVLHANRVVFIHSLKAHNDVINRPDNNFQLFLENTQHSSPAFSQTGISADSMIKIENERMDAMIGTDYPSFNVTLNNKLYSSASLKGKTLYINLWFAACVPCMAEMEDLNKLYDTFKDRKDFEFISFTFDNDSTIAAIKKRFNIKYNIFSISNSECYRLNMNGGFPYSIVVDKEGKIRYITHIAEKENFVKNIYPVISND